MIDGPRSPVRHAVPAHWDDTYSSKSEDERSWSEGVPNDSLFFITETGVAKDSAIVDVGAGASRLLDELLARGYRDLSALDASSKALEEARARIGDTGVRWIVADVTEWTPDRTYALWHDRAVFHFLVDDDLQAAYVKTAAAAIQPQGFLVLATFSSSGPVTCSGLPVRRWSGRELTDFFADDFTLVATMQKDHVTPWGATQPFTWVSLQRREW